MFQKTSVQLKHVLIYLSIQFDYEKFISKILPYRQYKMFLSTLEEQRNSKLWKKLMRWRTRKKRKVDGNEEKQRKRL